MLRQLYYLFKKGPENYRKLKKAHNENEKVYDFDTGGIKPKKSNGSQWVCHKLDLLKMCKHNRGICNCHLTKILEESTTDTEKEKAKKEISE